jgi:hypothetical protein
MSWTNSDGLYVKFGTEEVAVARGGEYATDVAGDVVFEFSVNYTDALTVTPTVLGDLGSETGSFGVHIPKGLRIKEVEVFTMTAFTSSGTIGSATLVMGLKREDRTTELDHDGFTAAGFVGGVFDAAGETTVVRIGTTGVGALVGTTLANDGLVCVSNSAHASHPFTAGRAIVRVKGYWPTAAV